jgi:hypothetical protein
MVILSVEAEHTDRAAAFCQRHRHFTTSEAMDDLAAEFERVAREARAQALKDAAEWVETTGRHFSSRERQSVAFECVNIIRTRATDRPA